MGKKEERRGGIEEVKKRSGHMEIYITNKRRKKIEVKGNKIGRQVWRKYFMKLLEGEEIQQVEIQEREEEERQEGEKEEEEIKEEEIGRAIRRIKGKKAHRIDNIPIEAWRYAGTAVRKELMEMIKVWKKGIMPKDWRTSIIVPLYKRGDQEEMGNYRGISLLCAPYKIYAEIIRDKK